MLFVAQLVRGSPPCLRALSLVHRTAEAVSPLRAVRRYVTLALGGTGGRKSKEGRGGRAARTDREQTAPAGHFEAFAKNASYMGGLR